MSPTLAAGAAPVVSFDDEPLILVDRQDNVRGYESKARAHLGDGMLHRAFSIFLFNAAGDVLLQQRSRDKPLWGGFWSNSCCSHPRRGESMVDAAKRRLFEEVGVSAPLTFLYRFEYQARFGDVGSEHELCSVFAARSDAPIAVNPNEISDHRFVAPATLDRELETAPDRHTPWLKLEWPRIRRSHWETIEKD